MEREPESTLTVEQVAKRLGIGRGLAYEAVKKGEIPSIRIGSRILVPRAALERLESAADRNERKVSRQ